jgi:hypothetical protein
MTYYKRIYSPTNIRKNSVSTANYTINGRTEYRYRSSGIGVKNAPQRYTSSYKIDYDTNVFAPSGYVSTTSVRSPTNYRSTSLRYKYAPYDYYKYYLRYAPYDEETLNYVPILATTYRPQPVIISNNETIRDYYEYLINLLMTLR